MLITRVNNPPTCNSCRVCRYRFGIDDFSPQNDHFDPFWLKSYKMFALSRFTAPQTLLIEMSINSELHVPGGGVKILTQKWTCDFFSTKNCDFFNRWVRGYKLQRKSYLRSPPCCTRKWPRGVESLGTCSEKVNILWPPKNFNHQSIHRNRLHWGLDLRTLYYPIVCMCPEIDPFPPVNFVENGSGKCGECWLWP